MRFGSAVYAIACLVVPCATRAQAHPGMDMGTPGHAAHDAMAGKMSESAHMRMTPIRPRTEADSVRAMALADTLRRVLARYADPADAERDGYKLFLPKLKNQKVYHYTNWGNALGEAFRFNPSKPTSVLYKKGPDGRMQMIGAMYTMPKNASEADLDKRVPLSVASWHLHTNLCAPKKGEEKRYLELQQGIPRFGLAGSIATKAECDAADGVFHDVIFGWMVHANVFEGTDLESIWGHGEDMEHSGHKGS